MTDHVWVGGRRLAYVRQGAGQPLLLIQGMAVHHRMWGDGFVADLARHFDVIAYDHQGIGTSDRADDSFTTTADLAADAAGLVTALGLGPVHVFGVSLGGMVAQELAIRHPELARTLTIGCSWAGGVMSETAGRIVAAIATKDLDHSLRTSYEANLSQRFATNRAVYERYVTLTLAVKVPVPVVLTQFEASKRHDTRTRLAAITAPTLVIHGTEDAMLPVANGKLIANLIPGARLELLPDAGHLFWWEEPDRTVDLLRGVLA